MSLFDSLEKCNNWSKEGKFISLREYNRLAQIARRKNKTATEYLTELGYALCWGKGQGKRKKS